MRRSTPALLALLGVLLASCDRPPDPLGPGLPSAAALRTISDGARGGNPGFFFLPPMVPRVHFSGVFDASLSPTVGICVVEGTSCADLPGMPYTTVGGPGGDRVRADREEGFYAVNWHSKDFDLDSRKSYRVEVRVAGTLLGFADLDVVDRASDIHGVKTGSYVPLVKGATLPIRFRVEVGAVVVLSGEAGGTVSGGGGAATVVLPPDAVSGPIGITVVPVAAGAELPSSPAVLPGTVYDFGPDGATFDAPVTITLRYDPATLPAGIEEGALRMYTLDRDARRWRPVDGSSVDAASNTVSGRTTHFSEYAILATAPVDRVTLADDWQALGLGAELYEGDGAGFWVVLQDVDGNVIARPVSVTSSDPAVLSVDAATPGDWWWEGWGPSGAGTRVTVTARRVGTALLIATSETQRDTLTLQVNPQPVASVSVSPVGASIGVGASTQLTATPYDRYGNVLPGREITWKTENASVVRVSASGVATGVANGRAPILAMTGGFSARAVLSVGTLPTIEDESPSLSSGAWHTCYLRRSGETYCWGSNRWGQAGSGSFATRVAAVRVAGGHRFVSLAAGLIHTCGLTAQGEAYCWGAQTDPGGMAFGQVGDGSYEHRSTPTPVAGGHVYQAIRPGGMFTCALISNGHTVCWGAGINGTLADGVEGGYHHSLLPVLGAGTQGFAELAAGQEHACAITGSGAAYCWGLNAWGAIGTGETTFDSRDVRTTPTAVAGGHSFTAIANGMSHACGLTTGGEVYCWGFNSSGQLGRGTASHSATPARIASGERFVALGGGRYHTCGIAAAGTAYCWGSNDRGQLGTGVAGGVSMVPVPVAGASALRAITGGDHHTCALSTSDEVYCWGDNELGQLGDTSGTARLEPTRVPLP